VTTGGYQAVMMLADERPDLLVLVRAIHEIVERHGNQFSGSAALNHARSIAPNSSLPPTLRPLSARKIVATTGASKQGHRAFYRLVDSAGVERALRDLGVLAR
jgi:hypothetical protein